LASVESDAIEAAPAVGSVAFEQDLAAARRPGRPFVAGPGCQRLLAGPVDVHDPDAAAVLAAAGEGDQLPVRAPRRRRIPASAEADPPLPRPVRIHDVELLGAAAVAFED